MKVVAIVVNGQVRQYVPDLDVARLRVNSAILEAGVKETLWHDSHTNRVRESRTTRSTIIELREVTVGRDFYMGPIHSIATSEWHIADLQDIFMKPVLPV